MKDYRIAKPSKIVLKSFDPSDTSLAPKGKEWGLRRLEKLQQRLADLQDLLYANRTRRVLVVLQGMDTAGKDGTIKHVFSAVNPQGVRVESFKQPTPAELARDYLWRVHRVTPSNGEITIFNRSHYEDVLTVRVHKTVEKSVWEKRYAQINHFEEMMAQEGTLILKFFLHIDHDEQTRRLKARLDTPDKQWKLSMADLKERQYWDDYTKAYEAVLSQCGTPYAPWYVVPANHKWYRNFVISSVLVEALEGLKLKPPTPDYDPATIVIK